MLSPNGLSVHGWRTIAVTAIAALIAVLTFFMSIMTQRVMVLGKDLQLLERRVDIVEDQCGERLDILERELGETDI